jgi:hypothetical protein
LTFYLTFPTLNIISKYFSNIVILIRFADVELPCRYAVIKSLLLLLLLLLLFLPRSIKRKYALINHAITTVF